MCGRYTLHLSKKKLLEALSLEIPEPFGPDYNIGPGHDVVTIANHEETGSQVEMMHWGLKTPQNFHINARSETADTTPRFRESWAAYRCLIPANGYYEWYKDGISKQPYYLYPENGSLLFFAGLYFPPAFDGAPADCVLLTTEAHESIKEIHDRMPVVVSHDSHYEWLTNKLSKSELLQISGKFAPSKHPVSYRVNSVQNKESRLIKATAPETDDQMRLF